MDKPTLLRETDLFLLDLDGTVYLDERPIGCMQATLERLRAMGKKLVYLTNNSSKTEAQYRAKLARIGLLEEGDGVYTSGMATAEYLMREKRGARVYLVGTEELRAEFAAYGILLEDDHPDLCVLAYDVELTFEKLRRLDRFLRDGLPFIATHPDDVCPTADGSMPDVGSFLALLEKSSGRRPDLIVGKPFSGMGEELARRYVLPKGRMCMVGDRMHTDIRFANNNGMHAILVLSGETTAESMRAFPDVPDLVLPDFNAIF